MPLLTVSSTLDAPIEKVWAIVGDFGGLTRWSQAIQRCTLEGTGVGSHRIVTAGASVIRERLQACDPQAHFIEYRPISGSTLPLTDPLMSLRLTALNPQQTRLDWVIDGQPAEPRNEVVERLRARYLSRIDELESALRGEPPISDAILLEQVSDDPA